MLKLFYKNIISTCFTRKKKFIYKEDNNNKENELALRLKELEYREKDLALKEREIELREREAKIREMELSNCEKEHQLKLVN